ncbi:MAG: polyprenyl synthetase family protein [Elusimicrobiales bacterium]|nr:polyprenyl synthetase family protein [Elusimicrobiales bacterium]
MTSASFHAYAAAARAETFAVMQGWLREETLGLPAVMRTCMADYPARGGKALRPLLLRLFGEGLGASAERCARLGAACELFENWALACDDIMDDSLLRRGKPAIHRLYGRETAMNSMAALTAIMPRLLYRSCGLPPRLYGPVLEQFYDSTLEALGGQHLELSWRARPLAEFGPRAYFAIAAAKTASYTTVGTARLGAILAGRRNLFPAVDSFGLALGKAFQLMDDILDVESEGGGAFGKALGNDLLEGKKTLLAALALKKLKGAERRRFEVFYEPGRSRPRKEALWARETILRSGAAAACRRRAAELSGEALTVFGRGLYPAMKAPFREYILEFVSLLKERAA